MTNSNAWGAAPFTIHRNDGTVTPITVTGRDRWALECLLAAGARGCTPIDSPGPRWSGYVHNLRDMGITIETITEKHGGRDVEELR